MKILIVGSGAREHALGWKLKASPVNPELFFAPGNAGTAGLGLNLDIGAEDVEGLAGFARRGGMDLVVVGPELPLSLGLADRLAAGEAGHRVPCFGPSAQAARIESSKAYSKAFMRKYGIPTADFRVFSSFEEAQAFAAAAPWPFVVKASGLAAGKGVFVPDSVEEGVSVLRRLLLEGELGASGAEVVVEERLSGEEVSLLGFCDGKSLRPLPLCQDHKRLLEGELGPNTGGMGALASALPGSLEEADLLSKVFLEPAAAGLAAEGSPFVGVLYAGLIMTGDGPRALEYNCRLGDPETQALLPLLDSDLLPILRACVAGGLDSVEIAWKRAASACIVLASEGYGSPGRDEAREIVDFGAATGEGGAGALLFHAATRLSEGKVLAQGGRLLCAAAGAPDLDRALEAAYARLARVKAPRTVFRRDIGAGRTALRRPAAPAHADSPPAPGPAAGRSGAPPAPPDAGQAAAYAASGVDIAAGDKAVELMAAALRSTYGKEVLAGIGSFGGVYDASALSAMRGPVLVSSTDGVGTKVKLAAQAGRYAGIGKDIVNHCVDDILVQGARPLFFLDYVATSKLDPAMVAQAVSGMAEACGEAGCALIGGETAEMPGVYLPGEFDLAGTIVGAAERDELLPRADLAEGDLLVGLPSSGLHTNGYSLARRVFGDRDLEGHADLLGRPLIDALLEPHRSYLGWLGPVLGAEPGLVKALAHITGGGFEGNIPRILPSHLDALVDPRSWPIPPLFRLIREKGGVELPEMYRVFNMGVGMVAVVAPGRLARFAALLGREHHLIGRLAAGEGRALLDFGGRR